MILCLNHVKVGGYGPKQPEHYIDGERITFASSECSLGTKLYSACSAGLVLSAVCPLQYMPVRFDQFWLMNDDATSSTTMNTNELTMT